MDADKPALPEVIDRPHAPVIYLESAPALNYVNGVIGLTLTTSLLTPDQDGLGVTVHQVVQAYLRMNVVGAQMLKDSLEKALLLAMPASTEDSSKN